MFTAANFMRCFFLAACAAGLRYALAPVDNRGRNHWLPPRWAIWVDYFDWWLNFGAFVVLAAGIVCVLGAMRPAFYRWCVAVAIGSLLALGIEIAQFRIPGRMPDPGDLTAALAGSMIGASVAWSRRGRERKRTGGVEADRPMRICFLDQTGQLGGAELMLLDLAARARDQHEIEVILFNDGPFRAALEARGVRCRVDPLGKAAASRSKESGWKSMVRELPEVWGLACRLARRIQEFDADVVYSNTAKALLVGALAARWARRPLVHHLHDIIDAAHFSRANRWLLVGAANWGAGGVIANSEATAAAFVTSGGRRELIRVIPNGFEATRFERPGEEMLDRLRAEWPWNVRGDGGCAFGLFGRLTAWKGQMEFLEALAAVPAARGVIVGAALFTEEDRAYEETLRRRAEGADLRDRVWFTGFRTDVVGLMHAVDVVVHCSTQPEPFGRVIVEAQLCGVPVIATRAGGAAEIVNDGETGLLCAPGDRGELAERMAWMIQETGKREQMGIMAREEARTRYGLEKVFKETSEFLGEVLNRDCQSGPVLVKLQADNDESF